MPFYTPKFSVSEFEGSNGILASEHLQYLEAGATLDANFFKEQQKFCIHDNRGQGHP